jgi:hypothetical protein
MQAEIKLDGNHKTLVQTRNRHQLKSCVCKSQRGGQNIASYHNRDSKSTKERSRIKDLFYEKCNNTKKGYAFSTY